MFVMVFHRILDFKTGLDFYPGPFSFLALPLLIRNYTSLYKGLFTFKQPVIFHAKKVIFQLTGNG
jgi:hypothetical protein